MSQGGPRSVRPGVHSILTRPALGHHVVVQARLGAPGSNPLAVRSDCRLDLRISRPRLRRGLAAKVDHLAWSGAVGEPGAHVANRTDSPPCRERKPGEREKSQLSGWAFSTFGAKRRIPEARIQ